MKEITGPTGTVNTAKGPVCTQAQSTTPRTPTVRLLFNSPPHMARKRPRAGSYTISQRTETTEATILQGLQASRHAITLELLKNALLLVEKAVTLSPSSTYNRAVQALQAAIQSTEAFEQQATPTAQPAKPAKPSQP